MSAAKNEGGRSTYVGVNLLPDEIKQAEGAAGQRRMIVLLTILVAVAVAGIYLWASFTASGAAEKLAAAHTRATQIVKDQSQYGGGQIVAGQISTTQDAQKYATTSEVDWASLITDVLINTPASVSISSFEIEGATPIADAASPAEPLEAPRIGSIRMVGVTGTPTDVLAWIHGLEKIDGFAGAPIVQLQGGAQYTVEFYVSASRVTNRFATPSPTDSSTPAPTTTPGSTATPSPTPTSGNG